MGKDAEGVLKRPLLREEAFAETRQLGEPLAASEPA